MSIQQGCVPKVRKIAKVIPIFKDKGLMLEVKNYRPISLTNVYCKTLKRGLFAAKLCLIYSRKICFPFVTLALDPDSLL